MSLATDNWTTTDPFTLVTGMRRLVSIFGNAMSDQPTPQEVQAKFKAMGDKPVFAANVAEVDARLQAAGVSEREFADLLQATGTLNAFDRRSVYGPLVTSQPTTVIMTGAMANWMARRIAELERQLPFTQIEDIILLGGERVCDSGTERSHPVVQAFGTAYGRYPTERELLPQLAPYLREPSYYVTGSLETQVAQLLAVMPELSKRQIYVPTNANAASVPLTVRRVIRSVYPEFDSDPERPQFSFSQDSFPLARTADELSNSRQYQNPKTVPSGLVRLLKELLALQTSG